MDKQYIKSNVLIALFMGAEKIDIPSIGIIYQMSCKQFFRQSFEEDRMYYHKSWEWIMPVVTKIESLGYVSTIERMHASYEIHRVWFNDLKTYQEVSSGARDENKLIAIYQAVVYFIEWYNNKIK